jgi:hypothetical protein
VSQDLAAGSADPRDVPWHLSPPNRHVGTAPVSDMSSWRGNTKKPSPERFWPTSRNGLKELPSDRRLCIAL